MKKSMLIVIMLIGMILLAGIVDSFAIAGIAAGKAFLRGLGFGKPSSKEIFERWAEERGLTLEEAKKKGTYMPPDVRKRIERELMLEQLQKEIGAVELLGAVWKRTGEKMREAIPPRPEQLPIGPPEQVSPRQYVPPSRSPFGARVYAQGQQIQEEYARRADAIEEAREEPDTFKWFDVNAPLEFGGLIN